MKTSEQAKIWERNIDRKAAQERADRVISLIKKYNPSARNILELGVGLGAVLVHFSKKYNVFGLDLQKEYVKIARRLVPKAKLYVQSMHNFRINEKFDVIFSVHECINEVKPYKNWESTFKSVNNHLNDNGLFIFDMRTLKHLEDKKKQEVKLEKTPTGYVYDDFAIKENKLYWNTTYFNKLKDGSYKIEKDSYFEEVYDINKVRKSLSKHFNVLKILFFQDKTRAMFVCRKKMKDEYITGLLREEWKK